MSVYLPNPSRLGSKGSALTLGREIPATLPKGPAPVETALREKRWDPAFLAMLFYLVVEYARLAAVYPILAPLNLGKLSVLIALLGYLTVPREKSRVSATGGGIDLTIVLFLAVALLSSCFAQFQGLAWDGFVDIVRWAVIYFLIARVVSNSWRMNIFVLVLLLLNVKLAQFTIRSYHNELASGLPEWYLAKTGIGAQAGGFFGNGEDLGLGMVVVWPIAGYVALAEKRTLYRLAKFGIFILILLAILFCGSRGALVGAAMVAAVAWIRKPKIGAAILMVLVLVPAVIYVMPKASMDRMRSAQDYQNDKTASHRIFLWKAGMRMFPDYPILGVGPDNYALKRMLYYAQDDPNPIPTVQHNTFVQVLTELGALGSICFLALLFQFVRLNAKTRKLLQKTGSKESYEYCLVLGLDLAMAGFLTSGFFHSSLYYPHLWLLLGLSVGLHTAVLKKYSPANLASVETTPSLRQRGKPVLASAR